MPDLNPRIRQLLDYLECCIIGVFTLEYGARVATAPKKLKFIFSFYGLIDLIAILPFYLMLMVDLRSLRALQLLRLLRVLKWAAMAVPWIDF